MFKRGNLWIITNENLVIKPLLQKDILEGNGHTTGIMELCKENKLQYNFKEDDYHEAPCSLANDGHIVIKSDDRSSNLIYYIPNYVSDRQLETISSLNELYNYQKVSAFSLYNQDGKKDWKIIEGNLNIMHEINKKNIVTNHKKR